MLFLDCSKPPLTSRAESSAGTRRPPLATNGASTTGSPSARFGSRRKQVVGVADGADAGDAGQLVVPARLADAADVAARTARATGPSGGTCCRSARRRCSPPWPPGPRAPGRPRRSCPPAGWWPDRSSGAPGVQRGIPRANVAVAASDPNAARMYNAFFMVALRFGMVATTRISSVYSGHGSLSPRTFPCSAGWMSRPWATRRSSCRNCSVPSGPVT